MARTALVIYNPAAGQQRSSDLPQRVAGALKAAGVEVELAPTSAAGDATRMARDAADGGAESVFALGGDGTFREVAEGLLGSDTALGTLPGGTINVLPWSLGLPKDPERAAALLGGARAVEMDVGLCNQTPFLILSSFGLDGRVMARVRPQLKRLLGRVAVGAQGFTDWLSYSYPKVLVRAHGREIEGSFAAVCNLPHYGGSTVLAPRARPSSGQLELIVFRGKGRAATLSFALDLLRGRHTERSDVEALTVDEVEIHGPPDLPMEIDGDGLKLAPPHKIKVAPHRLKILAPV